MSALGVLALVAGLVVWFLGGRRLERSVTDLAPAPVGCETNLDFDGAGTYYFFVETKGSVGALDGDCAGADRDYELNSDTVPRVELTLVDGDGTEVDLERVEGPSYDAGGRAGTAIRRVELDDGGEYRLAVDSNEAEVVVRVGRDPARAVGLIRGLGIGLAVAGLASLLAGLLLSRRGRARPAPAASSGPVWQPSGGPAPVAPPNAAHPPSPPYVAPGGWGPQPGGWPAQPQPGGWPPAPPGGTSAPPQGWPQPQPPRPDQGWPPTGR